ncbi:MAG: hypothetical protein KGL66_11835 [Alphaproteobacteria bacterium]|nr:hypothetical protein [Alphaproteobacteria bacterium]
MFGGQAQLKHKLAKRIELDVSRLPYDETVLAQIAAVRVAGRHVYLASASDIKVVRAIAEHFGFFEGWLASDGAVKLTRERKAFALAQVFGERGGLNISATAKPIRRPSATRRMASSDPVRAFRGAWIRLGHGRNARVFGAAVPS